MTETIAATLEQRLRSHTATLAADIGERNVFRPDALAEAAEFIRSEWRSQGHAVRSQSYRVSDIDCENLEVTIAGGTRAQEIVILGAHYDSVVGSPGADDNASGVAALLEIARLLAGSRPARTIRLVAFVNEEPPFFFGSDMGSGVYARAARKRGDDVRVMLSLEMLGYYSEHPNSQRYPPFMRWFYPNRADFIAFVSNFASRQALQDTVRAFRAHSDFPCESLATFSFVPGVAWSDQLSFWRERYPALMVTDTAFYRNPYYHTRLDTPDRLCYPKAARVVQGLALAALDLASDGATGFASQ